MRLIRGFGRNLIFTSIVALGLMTLAVAVHAGWSSRVGEANLDPGTPKAESSDLIFADGFESGDAAAWGPGAPSACPIPNLSLPTPTKR